MYSYDTPFSQHIHEYHTFKIIEVFLAQEAEVLETVMLTSIIIYIIKKCEFPVSLSSKNEQGR